MDFLINNNNQGDVLPRVVEALQRLQDDPRLLANERDQRYDEPPSPYPESGETTQPPTPALPAVDESHEREKRRQAHYRSTPYNQFESQARREEERLEHQISEERYGRRQTLLWDESCDLQANSENNVRSRWVEQGIWGDEWGPAWPKGSHPMSTKWEHEGGPFVGEYGINASETMPGSRWGHESDPEPEPEAGSEAASEPEPEPEGPPRTGILGPPAPKPPKPPRRAVKYIRTLFGRVPKVPIPRPTVRNPEASRPYDQFLYQVSKEKEWIRDEMVHQAPGETFDLETMAHDSVKDHWRKDGVWNPAWGDLPGPKWLHEEPCSEEEDIETPAADPVEQLQDAGGGNMEQAWAALDEPQLSEAKLGRPPVTKATDADSDDGATPVPGGAEPGDASIQPGRRIPETPSIHVGVTQGAETSEQVPTQPLQSPQSCEAGASESRREQTPHPTSTRSQLQVNPLAKLAETGRGDSLSGRSKRQRDDDDNEEEEEEEQSGDRPPSKRPPLSRCGRGSRARLDPTPVRRSARIAERQGREAAHAVSCPLTEQLAPARGKHK